MRITFTTECKACGHVANDGSMTALTAERDSTVERILYRVAYGDCCREKAMRAAGVKRNANGIEPSPKWDAFKAFEAKHFEEIRS